MLSGLMKLWWWQTLREATQHYVWCEEDTDYQYENIIPAAEQRERRDLWQLKLPQGLGSPVITGSVHRLNGAAK